MFEIIRNIIFFCLITKASSAHLPSYFEKCKTSDFECLRNKMEDALSKIPNGIDELAIPPIDPFYLKEVIVERRPGSISLYHNYSDINLYGISQTNVLKFTMDLKECGIYIELLTPRLEVQTNCLYEGEILTIPLRLSGELKVIQEDMKYNSNVTCEIYKEGEYEYLRFTNIRTKFIWGHSIFHFGNMATGNNQLTEQIEKLINDDPLPFMESFSPEIEKMWAKIIQDGANKFFSQVPLKEVFIDYE